MGYAAQLITSRFPLTNIEEGIADRILTENDDSLAHTRALVMLAEHCARALKDTDGFVWSLVRARTELGDAHLEQLVSMERVSPSALHTDVFACIADDDDRCTAARDLARQGHHLGDKFAAFVLCQPSLLWYTDVLLEDVATSGLYTAAAYTLRSNLGWGPFIGPESALEIAKIAATLTPDAGPDPTHARTCSKLAPTWSGTLDELRTTAEVLLVPTYG